MPTAFDVPPENLINAIAEELKKMDQIKPPPWAPFVKTGVHKERPPTQDDWWYLRTAAILRKLYVEGGPIGVYRVAKKFGGTKKFRSRKVKVFAKGSRNIIRTIFHQLERTGLVTIREGRGRVLSDTGISFIDKIATKLKKSLEKEIPDLMKY
ncbi:MAG: 30S ribosomal protein S19e [Candidatus Heimdallarchaeota archaeon]